MLRSMEELLGYAIHAKDGDIGAVHDFFFDDASWTVRYLVADTGTWLPGRLVLISPIALKQGFDALEIGDSQERKMYLFEELQYWRQS